MKSMKQMQEDILRKAKWDGWWPRAVHVGMGIIALANDQQDYDRLTRSAISSHLIAFAIVVLCVAAVVVWRFAA